MKAIHVLRKPCSGSTVVANVLKHGCGAINVDGCRIQSSNLPAPTKAPGWDSYNKANAAQGYRPLDYAQGDAFYTPSPGGRWPANVVFQHLEGCVQDGTRQVKGSAPASGSTFNGRSTSTSRGVFNGVDRERSCYTDPLTGTETVPAWDCAEGCPVAALDEQSGTLTSGTISPHHIRNVPRLGKGGVYGADDGTQAPREWAGDTGGASRYFKQFVGKQPVGEDR